MIELQVLTESDWPLWRELRLQALAEAPSAFGSVLADWQGDGDREERWRARLSLAGSHNLIAFCDGVAVGMAGGVPGDEPDHADLVSMWVAPAGRGKGVGDALIAEVLRWAAASGFGWLDLEVVQDNAAAIALYRRNGFTDTGRFGLMPDGVRQELIFTRQTTVD